MNTKKAVQQLASLYLVDAKIILHLGADAWPEHAAENSEMIFRFVDVTSCYCSRLEFYNMPSEPGAIRYGVTLENGRAMGGVYNGRYLAQYLYGEIDVAPACPECGAGLGLIEGDESKPESVWDCIVCGYQRPATSEDFSHG